MWGCSSVGERLSGRQEGGGSNPLISTINFIIGDNRGVLNKERLKKIILK